MSEGSIFYGLVALSVSLTLGYLSKATSKEVISNEQGQYQLRMHKLYNIVGIIALVFCAVFLVSPMIVDEPDLALYITVFLMLLLFGGLGGLSVLYFRKHCVVFDDSQVKVTNPLGEIKSLFWKEIVKAKFNSSSGLLTLISETGVRVKVHYHLVGFPRFVEQLEKETEWTAKELKLPIHQK